MDCVICKNGEVYDGSATVTLVRDDTTLVFRDVPARVCKNCGEEYVGEETVAQLLESAEMSVKVGVEVDVRTYKAA
jgi:YgiT-type zinc finger domain-containing protein